MNTLTTQGQNLQRERIIMEEKPGKRCTFGGSEREMPDPWKQAPSDVPRDSKPPGIVGYGGSLPRVRPEFQGPMASEAQSAFDPPRSRDTVRMAPGGGASALGTAPVFIPGARTVEKLGLYESLQLVRDAAP